MKRVALLLALLLASTAGAATTADPGISAKRILIGGTVPLSGEAAAFGSVGPGAKAYFDYVNSKGGVNGRRIEYRYYDDAYDPVQTVQLTRRLVEQDKVFADLQLGRHGEQRGDPAVPEPAARAAALRRRRLAGGLATVALPLDDGLPPELRRRGRRLRPPSRRHPQDAKIAVLFENTPLGTDMTKGLERWIRGKGPTVVAKQSYELTDTDVTAQVALLRASGADTLMLFATPKFAIQGFAAAHKLAWKPQVYVASISIEPNIMAIARLNAPTLTKGALSVAFVKNPNDPIWRKDPALALYRKVMSRYHPRGKPGDVYNWYGMTVAWTMVETLKRSGKTPTRASLLRAAQNLSISNNPFLLPGIALKTSKTRYFPLDKVYLYRYDNRQWVKASSLLDARG